MSTIRLFMFMAALLALMPKAEATTLKVVATLEPLAQIAEAVGGDRVEVQRLAQPGQDPHFVPPKPTLARHLARADALLVSGLDLEVGWLPPLIEASRNRTIRPGATGYIDASQFLTHVLGRPTGQLSRAMGDVHPHGNPHWWLDPLAGAAVAKGIAERFAVLDPANADTYRNRAEHFTATIHAKLEQWRKALVKSGPIVTYHDSFRYFTTRFGIAVFGFIEPKPGVEPSTAHLDTLVEQIRRQGVHALWVESYHNTKTARRVATLAGTHYIVLPDAVQGHATDGYLALFDQIIATITNARKSQ